METNPTPKSAQRMLGHPSPTSWLPWRPAIIARGGNQVIATGVAKIRLIASTVFDHASTGNRIIAEPGFRSGGIRIVVQGHGNTVRFGADVRWNGLIRVQGRGVTVTIGDRCDAKGVRLIANRADIHIGNDCLLAQEIDIRSSDIHRIINRSDKTWVNPPAAVSIGSNVWIAGRVFIGKGVALAKGCVVGAGSTVTRSVTERDCVIAGNPARIIRRGIVWRR